MPVPNPPPSDDFRNVSVLARGPVLAAIQARAAERDLPLGRAALTLIEEAITATPATPALVNLETVSTDDLIDELVGRLQQLGALEAERARADAGEARAEAAESRLAQVASVIAGVKA